MLRAEPPVLEGQKERPFLGDAEPLALLGRQERRHWSRASFFGSSDKSVGRKRVG